MLHPKDQLAHTTIRPKHSFGQNFLADESHLQTISRLCLKCANDDKKTLVEMGAGLGALTDFLVEKRASVVAVERDRDLVPLLRKRFENRSIVIHEDNALTFDLDPMPQGFGLVGNLPYHHAADIALRALSSWPRIHGACFLVQLEVGERMAAQPNSKAFSSLSVVLQSRFKIQMAHTVPKGAFWPVPDVDGGVVFFEARAIEQGAPHTLADLEKVVRTAFQQRRKTLRNSLKGLVPLEMLKEVGIDDGARPEDVDVASFGRLASAYGESIRPKPVKKAKAKTKK